MRQVGCWQLRLFEHISFSSSNCAGRERDESPYLARILNACVNAIMCIIFKNPNSETL